MLQLKKNRIMFFDVETSGLIPSRSDNFMPEPAKLHTYPHILQLSFVLFNIATRAIEHQSDFYIRPPIEVSIPPIVTEMTGITREICDAKGVSILDALNTFESAYASCDTIISHNLSFDSAMIRIEQLRNNKHLNSCSPDVLLMFNPIHDDLRGIQHFCTMKASVDLCNIMVPRKSGNGTYKKWPTLLELYEHLFSQTPENLHNSMVDTLVGLRCYLKVRHNIDITDCEFDYLMNTSLL
jgi:DNA polymerase III epsilon subunit-like protein